MEADRATLGRELARHASWMRALAARLTADPGTADDLVQETWIAALRSRPAADRPLEPWLARVLARLAWKRRRGEERRARHEALAPSRESAPDPVEVAERIELQRLLVDAIAALDEPYRGTLVQHYYEGLASAEIARISGVPAGTVRWRLKRAHEELRARLDARYGSRNLWSTLLAPIAAPYETAASTVAGTAATAAAGALVMSAMAKSLTAAAVIAIAGLWWWSASEGARAPASEVEAAAEVAAPEPLAAAPESAPERAVAPARESQRAPIDERAQAPVASAAPEAAERTSSSVRVRARFVDAFGRPLAGVSFGTGKVTAESGEDGRAELALRLWDDGNGMLNELSAHRTGFATRRLHVTLTTARETDLGDVVLLQGSSVAGRVLDEEGRLRERARVGLSRAELELSDEDFVRRTGDFSLLDGEGAFLRATEIKCAGGHFLLEGVPAGRWRVYGKAEDSRYGWSEVFELAEGAAEAGVDLVLPALQAADRIGGVVLDPELAHVPRVRFHYTYSSSAGSGSGAWVTGEDGRFDFVVRQGVEHDLVAIDREGRWTAAYARGVAPGTMDVELRMGAPSTFVLHVRDPEGEPVEGCAFRLRLATRGTPIELDAAASAPEPGVYLLARPPADFDLAVSADGFEPATLTGLAPPAEGSVRELVLERALLVRGRVTADGKPIAGATVRLHRGLVRDGLLLDGFACLFELEARSQAVSGADGGFELGGDSSAPIWLRATAPGFAAALDGPLDARRAALETCELELTRGGAIEGRVIHADGSDGEGTIVGVNLGDGHPRTLRAGPGGRFRFDGLTPGAWQVVAAKGERSSSSITTARLPDVRYGRPLEWPCAVVAGRTTRYDLELERR